MDHHDIMVILLILFIAGLKLSVHFSTKRRDARNKAQLEELNRSRLDHAQAKLELVKARLHNYEVQGRAYDR